MFPPLKRATKALTVTAALGLAVAVGAQSAQAATSHGDGDRDLTPAAKRAGLTPAGGATMGWKNEQLTPTPLRSDAARTPSLLASSVKGIDVASYQGNVNWSSQWSAGKRFAYVKATEGTGYRNPYFSSQYTGSYKKGFIRGSYHFALPNKTSGAAQAKYFVAHGGGWSKDGKTLPGVLDIEYNPYGSTCYSKSASSMVSWIKDFTSTYKSLTKRDAVIYSTADWWRTCTGNSGAFHSTNPLWVARYASSVGTLPGGWPFYTFWQYSSSPIDQDSFSGSLTRLKVLANGS